MSELKNCPFCGGKAEYCDGSISCIKCKATIGGRSKLELFAMWGKRLPMDEHKARLNLEGMIRHNGTLSLCVDRYVYWNGHGKVVIEGAFTPDELEAIAWWVKNKKTS